MQLHVTIICDLVTNIVVTYGNISNSESAILFHEHKFFKTHIYFSC
jgi:hypothetical protein